MSASCDAVIVRRGDVRDLPRVAEIQAASPGAACWDVRDYLSHDFLVAERGGAVAGFSVARRVSPDESELLNLAVAPEHRRYGVASALIGELLATHRGAVYLEVRESDSAARGFYKRLFFQEVGLRRDYYRDPREAAVVMCFRS